jgi:hypothetical protein
VVAGWQARLEALRLQANKEQESLRQEMEAKVRLSVHLERLVCMACMNSFVRGHIWLCRVSVLHWFRGGGGTLLPMA